ncbi:hypothetical protein B1750_gp354 [Noumeavirus]|uniref:hypothetical protein n=1 Tax=Noumeavirus TaxID=1955558 RepID=UPI000982D68B|nr:hypothetical protein B1750_gp354 [Noumeavirus]AQM73335.1 hypothetical protein NMV_354 [Noumeavirus]
MHASEGRTEQFTETKNDMSVFSSLCDQQMGISEDKLAVALQKYTERAGLPACSTLQSQPMTPLELRNEWTGAGTQYGWKILWQPTQSNISSYVVNFQYDGGCPKGVQEFILSRRSHIFRLASTTPTSVPDLNPSKGRFWEQCWRTSSRRVCHST